ncbi:Uncharacterized protein dnm_042700 [Desulfonema magnum]|uniref:Uncharacterized protein n=1 Tax=Desulfonema magnum TaxID=45655 RepID=A0A975GPT4_9BACT|nr:Uncharacterized protein dnm_042700 [Desulfonema magnum]
MGRNNFLQSWHVPLKTSSHNPSWGEITTGMAKPAAVSANS